MSFMAIFIASILGSFHCVGMCGGVVLAYSGLTRRPHLAHASYHAGRCFAYTLLGALGGLLGERINLLALPLGVRALAPILMGALLVFWGASKAFPRVLPTGSWLLRVKNSSALKALRWPSRLFVLGGRSASAELRPLLLGLGSGLLPCGWLYSFVAVAVASANPAWGAGAMLAFWLGSLPALTSLGLLSHLLSERAKRVMPRISGVLVLMAGLAALAGHVLGVPFMSHGQQGARGEYICLPGK